MQKKDVGVAAVGFLAGFFSATAWNKQEEPGKVHVKGKRVHHGAVGLPLLAAGLLLSKTRAKPIATFIAGLGAGLALEDRNDVREWYARK